ncbi:MAG: hydrogenase maturation protease [Candidatus Marinimicrobia bacterium]|nr:hydrogenase maturation protease [Candidatus Neomarinimicrobiota bacterium]
MNFSEFYANISSYPLDKVVIIGLGNPNRKDDGAGLYLLKKLKHKQMLDSAHFIVAGRTPENYLQKILSYTPKLVIFIDSMRNSKKNNIELMDSTSIDINGFTTHSYSIRLVEKYLKNNKDIKIMYLTLPAHNLGSGKNITPQLKTKISNFLSN